MPDTIASSSIVVRMRRRAPDEVVEPYRLRYHEPQGLALGERLADILSGLRLVEDPAMPDGVVDRPADVWESLLGIAQAVGGPWQLRAARACVHFALAPVDVSASLSLTLLADLRTVFTDHNVPDSLPTSTILEGLHALEESPWRDLRGKALDPAGLARRLRGYQVSSANVRVGSTVAKGYRTADLHDVWRRYLPEPDADPQPASAQPATSPQP